MCTLTFLPKNIDHPKTEIFRMKTYEKLIETQKRHNCIMKRLDNREKNRRFFNSNISPVVFSINFDFFQTTLNFKQECYCISLILFFSRFSREKFAYYFKLPSIEIRCLINCILYDVTFIFMHEPIPFFGMYVRIKIRRQNSFTGYMDYTHSQKY